MIEVILMAFLLLRYLAEHEQALATCARIKAKHPDILDRLPNGLYRCQVAGSD